jgi:dUTP pyrophosphatase
MSGSNNHQFGLRGSLNASFKGELTEKRNGTTNDFWIYVPNHPFCNKSGRVKYHRFLVEQLYHLFDPNSFVVIDGKSYLKPELYVHHIDGNHDNNDINNLQVVTREEHRSIHNRMNPQARDFETGRFCAKLKVKVKRLTATAKLPYHATIGSAGWDLYADRVEEKEDRFVYYTGIAIQLPKHHCGLILPRSSVVNTGLFMGNSVGLLDEDYTGEISCVFYKRENAKPYEIGERIAQIVVSPVPDVEFEEADELSETARGTGGYGSTGK